MDLRQLGSMKAFTQPVITQPRHTDEARTAKEWLDGLVGGECTLQVFMAGTGDLLRRAPDAGWDLLALVDQYYRRGKISAEIFRTVKAHLQGLLVGRGTSPDLSLPPGASSMPLSVPVSVPYIESSLPVSVPVDAQPQPPPPKDAPGPATPRSPAVGDVLRGRYRVQGVLGRGGMGTVFAAADQFRMDGSGGDQRIAIKVLHTEIIKRPRLFAELRREFQHLQSLSHPNIVRVHEFDRDGDLAFFTMEYLSGALLYRVLSNADRGTLRRAYALSIVRDVGAAITHAHARGVVHGDLNPANIFITDDGEVRVLDFGASHQLHHGPWISEFDDHRPIAVATPTFASCQVLEGEVADARDDVYALACITYTLLSGKHPFKDETALAARTAGAVPRRPPGLGRGQWNALREGLQFDRERRPSDIRSWLKRLDLRTAAPHLPSLHNLMDPRPPRRSAATWSIAAALLAVVVAGAGLLATFDGSQGRSGAGDLRSWFAALLARAAPDRRPEPVIEPVIEPSITPDPDAAHESMPAQEQTVTLPEPAATKAATAQPAPIPSSSTSPTAAATTAGLAPAQNGYAPRARIELTEDTVDVAPGEAIAQIAVRRSRTFRNAVSFKWWTESGTAKPGQDFVPVKAAVEHIEPGKSSVNLVVPIVTDPGRRSARSFYVVIDEADDSAAVGPRTLTMVTIPGIE
jgi:serine/threonine protein kinase